MFRRVAARNVRGFSGPPCGGLPGQNSYLAKSELGVGGGGILAHFVTK